MKISETKVGRHSVRLTTRDEDNGPLCEASFTYDELEYSHGGRHGTMGYCVASALLMLDSGSPALLLRAISDAIEVLADYYPDDTLPSGLQDSQEKRAAIRMIEAGVELVHLRQERRKEMILRTKKTTKNGAKR